MKTFGIIGGYGAVASARFHTTLIKLFTDEGKYEDCDFPSFILANLPKNLIDETGNISDLEETRQKLNDTVDKLGEVDHILILCNTFHVPELINSDSKLFISLPVVTSEQVVQENIRKPLIVASETSNNSRIYTHSNYEPEYLDAGELIKAGMKGRTNHPALPHLVAEAETRGCDGIVLGCTDLTVFADQLRQITSLPIIDSVESAARKMKGLHDESLQLHRSDDI